MSNSTTEGRLSAGQWLNRLDQIYGDIAKGRSASLTCLAANLTPEAVYVHGCRSAA